MSDAPMLYELAGADPQLRFSPYCWKIRLAAAHKGVALRGEPWRFTEKERIAFSGQGLVPVLVDGETCVHDSWRIAEHLEAAHPEAPSLFGGPQGKALARFANSWADTVLAPAIARVVLPDIPAILHPADLEYFVQSREQRYGSLDALRAARPENLEALRKSLQPLRHTLRSQPYLCGDAPAYGDYAVFGMFMWARCVSPLELLAPDDAPVLEWRDRLLDAHGGLARSARLAA
ncbi:glutathione S-transferase family protein [Bordetella sp. 2513F-2]